MPTFVNCYHPYAERYLICPQVEKCAICKEIRLATDVLFWPPVSKTMPRP